MVGICLGIVVGIVVRDCFNVDTIVVGNFFGVEVSICFFEILIVSFKKYNYSVK